MVDFKEFLIYLKKQDFYQDQISHIQHIPKKEAQFGTLNKPLRMPGRVVRHLSIAHGPGK